MSTGSHLIAGIDAAAPAEGELAFWWLGQHGFVLKLAGRVIYLDPFLSPGPRRTVAPLLAPGQIVHADAIAGTHDHRDHIDRAVWPDLAAASPQAVFVVPEWVRRRGLAGDLGVDAARFVGLDDGQGVSVGPVRITAVPAAHEFLDVDADTGLHPYLGFIIEGAGLRVYHAGDTCLYERLPARLRVVGQIDLAFVPINGRDAERLGGGCIGNMTFQEAVDLVGPLGVKVVVPAHFEMFAHNSEDPQKFADYLSLKYPACRPVVPVHGQRVVVTAAGQVHRGD